MELMYHVGLVNVILGDTKKIQMYFNFFVFKSNKSEFNLIFTAVKAF